MQTLEAQTHTRKMTSIGMGSGWHGMVGVYVCVCAFERNQREATRLN